MTIDCFLDWRDIRCIAGSCIRPGGQTLTERALEFCSLRPGSLIADIGCGAGGSLEGLERTGVYRSVGLDYSTTLLEEAVSRLASKQLVRGRAETLPFKNALFDALLCECVLSVLGDKTGALQECARVLCEGGVLILSDIFAKSNPDRGQPGADSQGPRRRAPLAKEDLLGLLERLGLSLLLWEEHEMLLKEFAARMILAGVRLPDAWSRRQGQDGEKTDRAGLSYFLLVARKAVAR